MKAKTKYIKKVANRFHDIRYYENSEFNIKNKEKIEIEKIKLKTNHEPEVSIYINDTINKKEEEKIFNVLNNIYWKNLRIAYEIDSPKEELYNTDILNIVSSVPLLLTSYAKIRKNKGCTSSAFHKSDEEYNKLNADQKNLANKIDKGADGINMEMFTNTSILLKKGKYPWGTSKRIYIDKPGRPGSKRPITIPPFMDRIVQESIRNVLVAIYEPYFDKMNCSFGFRPQRTTHDAIYTLTNNLAQGLDKALEGDIKAAYDKVNREKLIEILEKKIKDRKFINLIKDRLNYEYFDKDQNIFIKEKEGIPQGGTDSPYLWNIYMLEFDTFIMTDIYNMVENINIKTRGPNSRDKKILDKERLILADYKTSTKKLINFIFKKKGELGSFKKSLETLMNINVHSLGNYDPIFKGKIRGIRTILEKCYNKDFCEITILKNLQKLQKFYSHKMNNLPYLNQNKKRLRFIYTRYADDWIMLTNLKDQQILKIKILVSEFLNNSLHATLSDEKTLITNIKKKPAHFLGFEIKTYRSKKIGRYTIIRNNKKKTITGKIAGSRVFAGVDKQRLIDRLHMKGYCDSNGFPREIPKLNNLEAFTIIDKTNSVLTGLVFSYVNFIRRPKTELSRWIYIIRYSCIKSLAQKHKSTLKKIFTHFKAKDSKHLTVEDTVSIEINGKKFSKTWRLHTIQSLMRICRGKTAQLHKKKIQDRFWQLYNNKPVPYEEVHRGTSIKDQDYLEKINWINLRTKASFELPCCICGKEDNIEMHHVKHVRKTKRNIKNTEKTWDQVMGLRNRKQIPVCRDCHINIIHRGRYSGGKSLKEWSIDKLYDNRIVNIENFIHKGDPNIDYTKSLTQKGWKLEQDRGL